MAKDHGPSVKDDKQYEGLRKKGMSKERAAKIANTPERVREGREAKPRAAGRARAARAAAPGSGGNRAQKQKAGRKGGKKSSSNG